MSDQWKAVKASQNKKPKKPQKVDTPQTLTTLVVTKSKEDDVSKEEDTSGGLREGCHDFEETPHDEGDYYQDGEDQQQPGEVDKLLEKRSRKGKIEYKVLWLGYEESDPDGTSWETLEDLLFEGYAKEVSEYDRQADFEKRWGKSIREAERQEKLSVKLAVKQANIEREREKKEAEEYENHLVTNLFGGGHLGVPSVARILPAMRVFVAHSPPAGLTGGAFNFYAHPNLATVTPLDLLVQQLEPELLKIPFLVQAGGRSFCKWFSRIPDKRMTNNFVNAVQKEYREKFEVEEHPLPVGSSSVVATGVDDDVTDAEGGSAVRPKGCRLDESSDVLEMIFSFVPGRHFLLICSSAVSNRWSQVARRMKSARSSVRYILKEMLNTFISFGLKVQTIQVIKPTSSLGKPFSNSRVEENSSGKVVLSSEASSPTSYDFQFLRSLKEDRQLERIGQYDGHNGSTRVAACFLAQTKKDQVSGSASFLPLNFANLRSQVGGKVNSAPLTIYLVRVPTDFVKKGAKVGTDATNDGHGMINIWESDRVILPQDGGDPFAPAKPIFGMRSFQRKNNDDDESQIPPPLAIPIFRVGLGEFLSEDHGGTIFFFRDLYLGVNPFLKDSQKARRLKLMEEKEYTHHHDGGNNRRGEGVETTAAATTTSGSGGDDDDDGDDDLRLPVTRSGDPKAAMLVRDLTHSDHLKRWITDARRVAAALPPVHVLPAASSLEDHRDSLAAVRLSKPWLAPLRRKNEVLGEELMKL